MTGIFDTPTKTSSVIGNKTINTASDTKSPQIIGNRNVTSLKIISSADIDKLGENSTKQSMAMSNKILASVNASDTDQFGEKLNNLIGLSKQLNPATMGKPGFMQKLFNLKSSVTNRLKAQYDTVEQRMNELVDELDKMAAKRMQRIQDLEVMYKENEQTYWLLKGNVADGNEMLTHLEQEVAVLQQEGSTDPFQAEKIAQVNTKIKHLQKRIDDFERGMQLCVFAAPDIRMQQEHNRSLASSVNDIKATTIPAWQGVFSRYILALETKKGAELVTSVQDATEAAFRMQADLIVQNSVAITTAQQRSVVSVETLEYMQKQLISAVDQARDIEQKAALARQQAKPQLQKLTEDLINRYKQ